MEPGRGKRKIYLDALLRAMHRNGRVGRALTQRMTERDASTGIACHAAHKAVH